MGKCKVKAKGTYVGADLVIEGAVPYLVVVERKGKFDNDKFMVDLDSAKISKYNEEKGEWIKVSK